MRKSLRDPIGCAGVFLAVVIVGYLFSIPSWLRKASLHNTQVAIVVYLKENDGKWPSSWDDIGLEDNRTYRKRVNVAWDIQPEQIYKQMTSETRPGSDDKIPVVYFLDQVPENLEVVEWELPYYIFDYFERTH